jgi:hypothetical protein
MPEDMDIRDKPYLLHKDILGLNFIREPGIYLYRRHYRSGLRSHIMQVLNPEAVEKENKGVIINGLRWYPRAEPLKILRIFRKRFNTLEDADEELKRVKIIQTYLAPDYLAMPGEFLVDYSRHGRGDVLLCGLQEYVQGQILDPWGPLNRDHLASFGYDLGFGDVEDSARISDQWICSVRERAQEFIKRLKQMIAETGHVPDLAGAGNLILAQSGNIKLVDINNISRVSFDPVINLDDRGYPVCDKSIEALSLIEQKLLGRPLRRNGPLYDTFLCPERMKKVKALDEEFQISMTAPISWPGSS